MISKGTQYLSAAGFGNIRVTAASMGSLDILGTLGWLMPATKQAIVGAFGATDGKAVIAATNAYLNALAATDRTKATALAGFINEDPMMVCSLGLEPELTVLPAMPIRGLERNGLAYINTEILVDSAYPEFEMDCDWVQYNGSRGGLVSNYDSANVVIGYELQTNGGTRHWFGADILYTAALTLGNIHSMRSKYNMQTGILTDIIDGTTYTANRIQSGKATKPLLWFTDHRISTLSAKEMMRNQRILANDIEHKYLPMLRSNSEIGVMDMASDGTFTFRKNAYTSGSFSIEYTLPDGTPWTPSTP